MAKAKSVEDVRDSLPKHRNPVKVIRAKCMDCTCGSVKEIEACPAKKCPLWPWRFGKNPYRAKREVSEEQKAAARERLANARQRKKSAEAPDE